MENRPLFNSILAILGLVLTTTFFFIPRYALIIAVVVIISFIVAAFWSSLRDVELVKKEIKKINEKLKIYEHISQMKADIEVLKKKGK